MNDINKKFKDFQNYLANRGIVIPFIRDENKPSVSLTLLLISFLLWCLGITKIIKEADVSHLENMVIITAGLYFSRKVTKGSSKTELIQQPNEGENK